MGLKGVSVRAVCEKVGMSRQNFYAQRRHRKRREVDGELIGHWVRQSRQQQPRLGTRKLHKLFQNRLQEAGVRVGRDRMFEILREKDLLLKPWRQAQPRTTQSSHYLPVFKNCFKGKTWSQPHQAWVADITYLRTKETYLYLAIVTDAYSRQIVGYHCSDTLESEGCLRAAKMALAQLPAKAHPIHHSDRGCQYCCHRYVDHLTAAGLTMSMTENDHCAENALAERVNGILKCEYGLWREFPTKEQARACVAQAIALYNNARPHLSLGYRIPAQVHTLAA